MGIFDRAKDTARTRRDPVDQGHGGPDRSGAEQGDRPAEAEVSFESDDAESVGEGQEPSQPPV